MDDRMIWVDVETSGLDKDLDPIFEIGLAITDKWGGVIAERSYLVWEDSDLYTTGWHRGRKDEFVNKMHHESGLWDDLRDKECPTRLQVEEAMLGFLEKNEVESFTLPMVGSSIQFDRERMAIHFPKLEAFFHYRNIDISTTKEECRRLNPALYAKLETVWEAQKKHRPLPDIYDSINERKFYIENFFFIEE